MPSPNYVRPNPVQDCMTFERWVRWVYPQIWAEWRNWSAPDTLSLWYWAEERCPRYLQEFNQLTWEV